MTEEESALVKRHIAVWKEAAVELDRIKWDELRALTEKQAAEIFASFDCAGVESWRSPERRDGAGLVEQQRWFQKARDRISS
jgi:hypothetical protein